MEVKEEKDWAREIREKGFEKIDKRYPTLAETPVEIVKNVDVIQMMDMTISEVLKHKCKGECDSFLQAEMIINDIKTITGCKSDDGLDIVESVKNLKEQVLKSVREEIAKELPCGTCRTEHCWDGCEKDEFHIKTQHKKYCINLDRIFREKLGEKK